MIRAFLIPLLAIAGIIFAVVTVVKGSVPPPASPPVIEPARAPYESFVAGSGLVEASTENIAIGSPVGAIVAKVRARVNESVKRGDALFELDTRELQAEMLIRQAQLKVAQRQLAKLKAGTRPEQVPPARARVAQTESEIAAAVSLLDDAQAQLARARQMADARAMSEEEVTRRGFAVTTAQARVAQARAADAEARAQLALLEAGTWDADIQVAQSQVDQAQASVDAVAIEVDRRTVRSPIDGVVLQSNTREGEFAPAGALATPLMLVGGTTPLHIRVDIDENEAWRVRSGSKATAFARGNKDITAPLTFVRFEPYVVPKRSLTGASTERVDTRVLQVIFSFDPSDMPVFVGQQMDVYIETSPATRGAGTTIPAALPNN
jgi:multidrug resistance efflux pump